MARSSQHKQLFLYFQDEVLDDPVCLAWIERSATACVELSLANFSRVFPQADSFHTTVIIPGQSAPGKRLHVPLKAAAKIEKSVPWMMEEELSVDLTQIHLSHTRQNNTKIDESVFLVLAAEHNYLRNWLDTLAQWGIHPQRLVPIHALLPESSTGIGLRLDNTIAYSDHNSSGLLAADSVPGVELLESGVCELELELEELFSEVPPILEEAINSLVGEHSDKSSSADAKPADALAGVENDGNSVEPDKDSESVSLSEVEIDGSADESATENNPVLESSTSETNGAATTSVSVVVGASGSNGDELSSVSEKTSGEELNQDQNSAESVQSADVEKAHEPTLARLSDDHPGEQNANDQSLEARTTSDESVVNPDARLESVTGDAPQTNGGDASTKSDVVDSPEALTASDEPIVNPDARLESVTGDVPQTNGGDASAKSDVVDSPEALTASDEPVVNPDARLESVTGDAPQTNGGDASAKSDMVDSNEYSPEARDGVDVELRDSNSPESEAAATSSIESAKASHSSTQPIAGWVPGSQIETAARVDEAADIIADAEQNSLEARADNNDADSADINTDGEVSPIDTDSASSTPRQKDGGDDSGAGKAGKRGLFSKVALMFWRKKSRKVTTDKRVTTDLPVEASADSTDSALEHLPPAQAHYESDWGSENAAVEDSTVAQAPIRNEPVQEAEADESPGEQSAQYDAGDARAADADASVATDKPDTTAGVGALASSTLREREKAETVADETGAEEAQLTTSADDDHASEAITNTGTEESADEQGSQTRVADVGVSGIEGELSAQTEDRDAATLGDDAEAANAKANQTEDEQGSQTRVADVGVSGIEGELSAQTEDRDAATLGDNAEAANAKANQTEDEQDSQTRMADVGVSGIEGGLSAQTEDRDAATLGDDAEAANAKANQTEDAPSFAQFELAGGAINEADSIDVLYERRVQLCRWIERNINQNNAINLLTGKYTPKSQLLSGQKLTQFAIWSASLSGIALCSYFIVFGALFYFQANQLEASARQRFTELFPHVREIRNIRSQTAGLLNSIKRGGSGGGGLGFAEVIGPIEIGLESAGVKYEVFRIRFNQGDGKFLLSVYTDSIASANIINASLNAQGFNTKLLSADSNSTQIAAIFSINTSYRSQI